MNVHSSVIHNTQKPGTKRLSINWWIDKWNVLYVYNGISFSNKKEWPINTALTWMSLENITLSERCLSQTTTCYMITFMWNVKNRQIHRDRSSLVVPGLGEEGNWVWMLMGIGFLWGVGEKNVMRLNNDKWLNNCGYTKNHWIVHVKSVLYEWYVMFYAIWITCYMNFMLYELYVNKAIF